MKQFRIPAKYGKFFLSLEEVIRCREMEAVVNKRYEDMKLEQVYHKYTKTTLNLTLRESKRIVICLHIRQAPINDK